MSVLELGAKGGKRARSEHAQPLLSRSEVSQLYERYKAQVFHLALRYGGGNVSWAEDSTQEVFLKLFRLRTPLSDPDALSSWFYRVTTRSCLNRLRNEAFANSPVIRFLLGERAAPRTPDAEVEARCELERVFRLVARLPPKERAAFYMLHVDGKDQNEIAAVLGHSKGYVSKLLKRANERLARLDAGGEP